MARSPKTSGTCSPLELLPVVTFGSRVTDPFVLQLADLCREPPHANIKHGGDRSVIDHSRRSKSHRLSSVEATAANILATAPDGWRAIHLCLIATAHAVSNGQTDPVAMARRSLAAAAATGYVSGGDQRLTRFTRGRITRWQTELFAVNESMSWRFPDLVLLVGWLVECGGPAMGRGPARAEFAANGVELMIGGTRWRYNNQRYGHGGKGLPVSHEFEAVDCLFMGEVRA